MRVTVGVVAHERRIYELPDGLDHDGVIEAIESGEFDTVHASVDREEVDVLDIER